MRGIFQILTLAFLACAPAVQADVPAGGLADPTRPSNVRGQDREPVYGGPALESTRISAGERRAMINGRYYGVGERFGGGVIVGIEPYEVIVQTKNGERRLRMVPQLPKPRSSATNGNDDANR